MGKLLLGFSWIEKDGLFLNVALFMGPQYTESVDGKQRKGFYVVSYSDEPCLEMVILIFVRIFSVGLKIFVMDLVGEGGGEEREIRTSSSSSSSSLFKNTVNTSGINNLI